MKPARLHAPLACVLLAFVGLAQAGGDPPEYTRFLGRWAQGCNYCHGRPPALPMSESASRIVAVGATTSSGAGLRAAMKREALGGPMDHIADDPELTDERLDTLRHYLIDVRDGAAGVTDARDGSRVVTLRNERSTRDPPVRLKELDASGPWRIDRKAGNCRVNGSLAGQASCTVVLRPATGGGANPGEFAWQFAPSSGLEPALRTVPLR